jgi:hypothetical protein
LKQHYTGAYYNKHDVGSRDHVNHIGAPASWPPQLLSACPWLSSLLSRKGLSLRQTWFAPANESLHLVILRLSRA